MKINDLKVLGSDSGSQIKMLNDILMIFLCTGMINIKQVIILTAPI